MEDFENQPEDDGKRKCKLCGWEGIWRECPTRISGGRFRGKEISLSNAVEECPRCGNFIKSAKVEAR